MVKGLRGKRKNRKNPTHYPELEKQLNAYVDGKIAHFIGLSYRMLVNKCVELDPTWAGGRDNPCFENTAAQWIRRWRRRNGYSWRRVTKSGQALPEDWQEKGVLFSKCIWVA